MCTAVRSMHRLIVNKSKQNEKMEIGPQLPPHLLSKIDRGEKESHENDAFELEAKSPVLPDASVSDDRIDNIDDTINDDDDNDGEQYCPALPPGFKQKSRTIIGPSRPEALIGEYLKGGWENSSDIGGDEEGDDRTIGPVLPTKIEESECLIRRKEEIESRARVKKDELSESSKPKKVAREEWMTELPPELGKNFGLGPRTFRSKEVNLGDRSVWTDTPSERENKKNKSISLSSEQREKSKKEINMEKYVSEHNKRYRSESLLDIHQKDQKKKKKEVGSTSSERRPFDRDVDLGARQMDAAKRKSLIKQSTQLNTKFQHSKQGPTYL